VGALVSETADERKRRQTRERVRRYRERSAARVAAGTPRAAAARPVHAAPERRAGRGFARWSPCGGICPLFKGDAPAHEQPNGGRPEQVRLPNGAVPARGAYGLGHRTSAEAVEAARSLRAEFGLSDVGGNGGYSISTHSAA
jgi:hypothetical protein